MKTLKIMIMAGMMMVGFALSCGVAMAEPVINLYDSSTIPPLQRPEGATVFIYNPDGGAPEVINIYTPAQHAIP